MSIVSIKHMHVNRVLAQSVVDDNFMLLNRVLAQSVVDDNFMLLSRVLAQMLLNRVLAQMLLNRVLAQIKIKSMVQLLSDPHAWCPCCFGLAFHTLTYPRCDSLLTVNDAVNACWMLMWICAIVLIINYWRLIDVVHLCEYV